MATVKFTTVPSKRLAGSITSASTSFQLNNILGWDGEDLASSDFGTKAYGVFRNDSNTQIELFEWDPTTIASASITILRRGLQFDGDLTTEVSANKLTWVKNETIVEIGSDVPQLLEYIVRVVGDQTIEGIKTFSSSPIVPTPSTATQAANKSYVDGVAIAGGADSSTTVKGITKLSVAPASASNPIAVGDNDTRVPTQGENDALVGTSGTPGTANKYVTNDDTGTTGVSKVVRTLGTGLLDSSIVPSPTITATYVSGMAITSGQPLALGSGREYALASAGTGGTDETISTTAWASQKITTSANAVSIKSITVLVRNSSGGTTSDTVVASIRANSAGLPTGADIETKTASTGTGSVATGEYRTITLTFASPVSVSASTDYHVVIRTSGGSNFRLQRANTGSTGVSNSSNSGSSWAAANGPLWYTVGEIDTVEGRVYVADANVQSRLNFIGFAKSTVGSAGSSVTVQTGGVVSGLSGLTQGLPYYVQDTVGTLGTAVGTYEVFTGVAASATELNIIPGLASGMQLTYSSAGIWTTATGANRGVVIVPPDAKMAIGDINSSSGGNEVQLSLTAYRIGKTTAAQTVYYSTTGKAVQFSWSDNRIYIDGGASGTVYFYR